MGDNFEGTKSGTFDITDGVSYTLAYLYDDSARTASLSGGIYHGKNATFELFIPETVEKAGVTYTVTSIEQNAFGHSVTNNIKPAAEKISKVTIPKTVKSIGANAFGASSEAAYFKKLTEVIFAEGSQLVTIGDSAFRGTAISEIDIPADVSAIGDRAFQDCTNLESVTFRSAYSNKPNTSGFSTSAVATPFAGDAGVQAYGYDEATGIRNFVQTHYVPANSGLKLGWTWHSLGKAPDTGLLTGLPGSGDYTGDGEVTAADVNAIRRASAGLLELTPAQLNALDVTGDGMITAADCTRVSRKAAGLES
jgi:hypothetical protein